MLTVLVVAKVVNVTERQKRTMLNFVDFAHDWPREMM